MALSKVIALPTIALTGDSKNITVTFRYRDSWKSDNFRKKAIKKKSKDLIQKGVQRGLRVTTFPIAKLEEQ